MMPACTQPWLSTDKGQDPDLTLDCQDWEAGEPCQARLSDPGQDEDLMDKGFQEVTAALEYPSDLVNLYISAAINKTTQVENHLVTL